jgi:hypothetical protein
LRAFEHDADDIFDIIEPHLLRVKQLDMKLSTPASNVQLRVHNCFSVCCCGEDAAGGGGGGASGGTGWNAQVMVMVMVMVMSAITGKRSAFDDGYVTPYPIATCNGDMQHQAEVHHLQQQLKADTKAIQGLKPSTCLISLPFLAFRCSAVCYNFDLFSDAALRQAKADAERAGAGSLAANVYR